MYADGFRNQERTSESGDWWQLGGVVVVQKDGKVNYHYISEILGDFPPESDIEIMALEQNNP